jgi:hypothetical protein
MAAVVSTMNTRCRVAGAAVAAISQRAGEEEKNEFKISKKSFYF